MGRKKLVGISKVCSTCREEKPTDEYYKHKGNSLGIQSICKTCSDVKTALYRVENRDAERKRAKSYYRRNLPSKLLFQAKHRAKKYGIPFDLTIEDIVIPTHCPILGIELRVSDTGTGPTDNSPTVDKVIPEKGYVRGNIAIISHRANAIKRDASPEEIEKLYTWIKNW